MTISRDRVQVVYNNEVAPTSVVIETSPIIPAGQSWQISRVIFGDRAIGDGMSGGFQVDWGNGGSWEVIAAAWLTGNTMEFKVNRAFTGDGVKKFRYIRLNKSASSKEMFLMAEGFKRIGDT